MTDGTCQSVDTCLGAEQGGVERDEGAAFDLGVRRVGPDELLPFVQPAVVSYCLALA